MPAGGVAFEDREDHLTPAEIETIAVEAHRIGVRHFKITGGEPTVRPDLEDIVARIARLPSAEISMTTNGTRLVRRARALRLAGLQRVTISMDSLRDDRFNDMTGGGRLPLVLEGLEAARREFRSVKINTVVIRGANDMELPAFVRMAIAADLTVRFIEFMPIGESVCARHAEHEDPTVPAEEILAGLESEFGIFTSLDSRFEPGVGPATVYQCPGGRGRIGFIHAMSKPFCDRCNRLRLTARGVLRSCLFDGGEVDLRPLLDRRVSSAVWRSTFERCTALKPETHGARGHGAMSAIGG